MGENEDRVRALDRAAKRPHRQWEKAVAEVRAIAPGRGRPDPASLPALRRIVIGEFDYPAKLAAAALKRLGPMAREAADDLVAAATRPWEHGCPQRFAEAVDALVRIAPDDPRSVEICRGALACDNHAVQRSAIELLARIASPEAVAILRNLDAYRYPHRCKPIDRLIARVLAAIGPDPAAGVADRR